MAQHQVFQQFIGHSAEHGLRHCRSDIAIMLQFLHKLLALYAAGIDGLGISDKIFLQQATGGSQSTIDLHFYKRFKGLIKKTFPAAKVRNNFQTEIFGRNAPELRPKSPRVSAEIGFNTGRNSNRRSIKKPAACLRLQIIAYLCRSKRYSCGSLTGNPV